MCNGSSVPARDAVIFRLQKPGVETPGYYQVFLRNINRGTVQMFLRNNVWNCSGPP